MLNGFIHSVRVPRIYKIAAKIARSVQEEGASFKTLVYEKHHPNVPGVYSLVFTTLQKRAQLDGVLRKTRILLIEHRMDPWLGRILITELLWGKQTLKGNCKPVLTVLKYERQLREALKEIDTPDVKEPCVKKVPKPRYVRINTLILSVNTAISSFRKEGWKLLPKCPNYHSYLETLKSLSEPYFIQDFHIPELLAFPSQTTFHEHAAYLDGSIVLQDKASCLPAFLLNPEPESTVMDMCAAPGMKTSHLASIMQNSGKIYAVEIHERRYQTLCEQVKVMDCISVKPINADALTLDSRQCPNVEYILVDPSCTGSGMTDRQLMDGTEQEANPHRSKRLQSFQSFLLRHALLSFPTVKKVIYSTCSIYPEENEAVIDEVLNDINDAYKLVPAKDVFGEDWINFSSNEYKCSDRCLYAKPEVDLCNGFFVAIFERNFEVPLPEYKRKRSNADNDNQTRKRKKRGKRRDKVQNRLERAQAVEENEKENEGFYLSANHDQQSMEEIPDEEPPKKKKTKLKHKETTESDDTQVRSGKEEKLQNCLERVNEDAEQMLDNESPKKKKKKKKSKNKSNEVEGTVEDTSESVTENTEQTVNNEPPRKKKKKSKNKDDAIQTADTQVRDDDAEKPESISQSVKNQENVREDVPGKESVKKRKKSSKHKSNDSAQAEGTNARNEMRIDEDEEIVEIYNSKSKDDSLEIVGIFDSTNRDSFASIVTEQEPSEKKKKKKKRKIDVDLTSIE